VVTFARGALIAVAVISVVAAILLVANRRRDPSRNPRLVVLEVIALGAIAWGGVWLSFRLD